MLTSSSKTSTFQYFDSESYGKKSIDNSSFDMRTSILAHDSLSNLLELIIFTSDLLHRCRYAAVARNSTCGEMKLEMLVILWELRWSLQTRKLAVEWR